MAYNVQQELNAESEGGFSVLELLGMHRFTIDSNPNLTPTTDTHVRTCTNHARLGSDVIFLRRFYGNVTVTNKKRKQSNLDSNRDPHPRRWDNPSKKRNVKSHTHISYCIQHRGGRRWGWISVMTSHANEAHKARSTYDRAHTATNDGTAIINDDCKQHCCCSTAVLFFHETCGATEAPSYTGQSNSTLIGNVKAWTTHLT